MSNLNHPQPAFDLLMALKPDDKPAHESILTDWYIHTDDAERGDEIRDHPEIWDSMEFPPVLEQLDEDRCVGQFKTEKINLNALAIGLGLEDVEYEPEDFPGLLYHLKTPSDATVLIFVDGTVISLAETESVAATAIERTVSRIKHLDIHEFSSGSPVVSTATVSDLISRVS